MRVLWFTNTPVNAATKLGIKHKGGGWMSSLENIVTTRNDIELGIAFFFDSQEDEYFKINRSAYYSIGIGAGSAVSKISNRYLGFFRDNRHTDKLLKVVEDFKPDLIQVFGSEGEFGYIIDHVKVPVIIHIQGIINACVDNWLPRGVTVGRILRLSPLWNSMRATGLYFDYLQLLKDARREKKIIASCRYFMGRTQWDRSVIKLMSPEAQYFHCDEMIRDQFWQTKWSLNDSETMIISTTMNPAIYKGLDMILKSASLLSQLGVNYVWNIYGLTAGNQIVLLYEKLLNIRFADTNVNFAGPVGPEELAANLQNTTIFVHPSHVDNSPNSVCEAMLMGVPVVAANVGGLPSLIQNQHDGMLYSDNDQYILVSTIIELCADKAKLREISTNAKKNAEARHDSNKILHDIIDIYYMLNENK